MSDPIPGVTDGTKDSEPYSLEDVAAIEAARGKPYARLRRTVEELDKFKQEAREILETLEGGGPAAETLFMLASRGTAKKIRELLK